jgi:hypothetical protein
VVFLKTERSRKKQKSFEDVHGGRPPGERKNAEKGGGLDALVSVIALRLGSATAAVH